MFPYFVLDQNQLRKVDVIAAAASRCRDESLRLLIPDGAGFEMSKSSEVFFTWRNSLVVLASYQDVVVVSSKLTELMRKEAQTG